VFQLTMGCDSYKSRDERNTVNSHALFLPRW